MQFLNKANIPTGALNGYMPVWKFEIRTIATANFSISANNNHRSQDIDLETRHLHFD